MSLAYPKQKFQDWCTQQWVILTGRKLDPSIHSWLIGPFGELDGIGEHFIYQLAQKENLIVSRDLSSKGLLDSFSLLKLHDNDIEKLPQSVIDFYEKTSDYNLKFNVHWNPVFKVFGYLVNRLFSQRINQLNIPTSSISEAGELTSEIIQLISTDSKVKYTVWLRKFRSTGKVIYSGVYRTCIIPSGVTYIQAIFPLPKGNATVVLKPSVGAQNELILDSSGKKFGDAGFYFLLNDSKGNLWGKHIRSFTDKLIVRDENGALKAKQILRLWRVNVARMEYEIKKHEVMKKAHNLRFIS